MPEQVKKDLTVFLKNNYDVMACNPLEMKAVSPDVIVHRLNHRKEAKVLKQRKWNFGLKRQKVIKESISYSMQNLLVRSCTQNGWPILY